MRRWAVVLLILFAGCSGDHKPPATPATPVVLTWERSPTWADNTPMTLQDVERWDIFCSPYGTFIDNDLVASVAKTDNLAFNLGLLSPHGISPGPDGTFVAMKCVAARDNQASAYSEPVFWEK